MESAVLNLKGQWSNLLKDNPGMRIRNAAHALHCSEVELLATNVGTCVVRLRPEFEQILMRIESLGYVMALTRNDFVVHEKKGVYKNWSTGPHASLFVDEKIDLRLFLKQLSSVFAVSEGDQDNVRKSLQFFGKDGEAIHKIYLTEKSNVESYDQLMSDFSHHDQGNQQNVEMAGSIPKEIPDESIDVSGFRNDWLNLKDTHDFYMLLGKYRLSRTQALRLAPEGNYANKVSNDSLRKVFMAAVENHVPIMVFVGNKGAIQIHTGEIHNLMDRGEWFNVIDPEFNLHLKENAIDSTWVVRKPTVDGMVTSLELFTDSGELIATIFGKRKPGLPELEEWREIIREIE